MDEFRHCDDVQLKSKFKHERTIIHIDLDCFYAQVEMLKNPELFTKPVGIKQQHYVITSNYVAREFGVKKCMLISEALALCPKLIIINGEDLHDYRIMSNKVTDVIKQFSKNVEKLGFDENFVDVSKLVAEKLSLNKELGSVAGHIYKNELENVCSCGCRERLMVGSQIADEIRAKIKEELCMTGCAGIGHNKLLAKLVGPTHKPNQQTTVFPCAALSLVSNLNCVRAIPGIGRKTSDILEALGIDSVTDAQNSSIDLLEKHFGKTLAHWIKGACYGVDDTEVKETGKQQVIGLEEAFKKISTMMDIEKKLTGLVERGMVLLQEDGRYPTTVRVSIRKYSNSEEYMRQRESKQCAINPSIFRSSTAKEQIIEVAVSLFKKMVDHNKPFHLTLIGLAFTKFQEETPAKNSLMELFKKKWEDKGKVSNKECSIGYSESFKETKEKRDDNLHETIFGNIDEAVLNELPEDIRAEVLENYSIQNHLNSPGTSNPYRAQNIVDCPPGVDAEVFSVLPHDIQLELIKDANEKNPNRIVRTSPKRQNSILNYLKK